MKRLFLFCLLVLTALYFLTSCENRTEGLLPIETTQDTPPAYVMASIRLQYPSAADMKITVIEPNKLWKVEFTVNGQIFEAFLDENGKWITNGRLGTVDEDEAFAKVKAYYKSQSTKAISQNLKKIRHPETRQLLYFTIEEGNYGNRSGENDPNDKISAYLFDRNGDFMSKVGTPTYPNYINSVPTPEIKIAQFDIENKKMVWANYNWNSGAYYGTATENLGSSISSTVQRLGWSDYSKISPVMTKDDYPPVTSNFNIYLRKRTLLDVNGLFSNVNNVHLNWSLSGTGFFNTRFPMTSPIVTKYSKFFVDETPGRFELFMKTDGTPLYVSEGLFISLNPSAVRAKLTKNDIPAQVLNQLATENLPPIDILITGNSMGETNKSYNFFYKGAKGEMVQFIMSGVADNGSIAVGYQLIEPIAESDIKPLFLETVKSQYPTLKVLKYNKFRVEDKRLGGLPSISDYNGFEIIFEDSGKTYSAVGVGAVGFDKPIIQQLF